jgi:phosphotransferase family enzyme
MMDEMISHRIARLAGRGVTSMEVCTGGYTRAARRRVHFDDGGTAFAKCATDAQTAEWLYAEIGLYRSLKAPFLPSVMVADTTDPPLLILEDLSHADWPPPWTTDRVDRVLAALEDVHVRSIEVPEYGKVVGDSGWHEVAADPAQLLAMGLVSESWLRRCLPALLSAQDSVETQGRSLCHFDLRSDNMCLRGPQAILIDWNNACRGNGALDTAYWLPSLYLEGGPSPAQILPRGACYGALVAGYFASRIGRFELPHGPGVRVLQRRQLEAGLDWILPELELPPVDGTRITPVW